MYEIKSTQAANQTWSVTEKKGKESKTIFSIAGGEVKTLAVTKGKTIPVQLQTILRAIKQCKGVTSKEVTDG